MSKNIIKTLLEREYIKNDNFSKSCTDPQNIEYILHNESHTVYAGFDPTDKSLHIGNLIVILGLIHFYHNGHRPIALVGGATGLIGDPSGKENERDQLPVNIIRSNVQSIMIQLEDIFNNAVGSGKITILDNYQWFKDVNYLEFLRDYGKAFKMGVMTRRESIKKRMDSSSELTFTEFSYMTIQSYDFLYLHENYGCTIQLGGSDQYGNILSGIDLINWINNKDKERSKLSANGIVFELLENSDGRKFGKSEGKNVCLDPELTSPYEFYQFWINTSDDDVEHFLKLFTLLKMAEIDEIIETHQINPGKRFAQLKLASEVTKIVHGKNELIRAQKSTDILFNDRLDKYTNEQLADILHGVPATDFDQEQLGKITLVEVLIESGLCTGKGNARDRINGGSIYMNKQRISDINKVVDETDFVYDCSVLLRFGKKKLQIIKFI